MISILFSLAAPASAATDILDQDLQNGLADSASLVDLIQTKLTQDQDVSNELIRLRNIADDIRLTNLLVEERFRRREERAKTIATKARDRHQSMVKGYRKALTEYLSLVDSLPAASGDLRPVVKKLSALLSRIHPPQRHPLIGSLPYRHLNLPNREPKNDTTIAPAYAGGDGNVRTADTAATPEAPASLEISALAQSLGWSPVNIYEYVKNSIETEWYWGCMKGAEETLHQKSGNDCDQATLLVALLRASGYPSRYVRGAVEFFPDMERAKHLTGIDSVAGIAELFRKAGIPSEPVLAGGKIANIRFEHIWVETQVPYANYRGALIDENGKTWLGLDTSIKVKGYEYSDAKDLFSEETISSQLSSLRDEYLGALQTRTPLEYLKDRVTSISSQQDPDLTADSYKLSRTLIPEHMKILPASLQFTAINVSDEYASLPEELKHKVRFVARTAENSELVNYELDVLQLSNRKVILSFEPETVEDQEIIDSFGGPDATPAYMVRLRPVLKVNDERKVVAPDGIPMGAEFDLSIELLGPGGEPEKTTNRMIAGNVAAIGVVAQRAISDQLPADSSEQTAEGLLHQEAMNYIDRWNRSEDELASLLHLTLARPLPTVATVGNVMDVTYVLDLPHQMTWKGVYCDADVRRVEAVSDQQSAISQNPVKLFMQLSSLEGSVLEHRLFDDDFGVESISTAKLIELAGGQLSAIDGTNIDSVLPSLAVSEEISSDIRNAVNQGLVVRLPQADGMPMNAYGYDDWTGIGYIKENAKTGESGWMLSGMIAGSTSALSPEKWGNQSLVEIFSHPYGGKANSDPLSAAKLLRITAVNMQRAAAGTPVDQLLMAFAVDSANKPVKGAKVTFAIRAGGGKLRCFKEEGGMTDPAESCTSPTEAVGIASAQLIVGEHTADNPAYIKLDKSDLNETQIGINIVEASVAAHVGAVNIDSPFEAHGLPDVQGTGKRVETVFPLGTESSKTVGAVTIANTDIAQTGMPNNPGGSLLARLVDHYGNPISNAELRFLALDMASWEPTVPLPQTARNIEFYDSASCSDAYPLYGECGAKAYTSGRTAVTDYNGAKADFVYGNSVNTIYTIQVSAQAYADVPPATWTVHSAGYADSPEVFFDSSLKIGSLDLYNASGALVNAAKAGDELKGELKAKLFSTSSDYVVDTQTETCLYGGQQLSCSRIHPQGTVKTTAISDGEVNFATTTGGGQPTTYVNAGKGLYTTHFLTAKTPEKNIIEAQGTATLNIPAIFFDKGKNSHVMLTSQAPAVLLQTGQTVYFDAKTGTTHTGVCAVEQGTNQTVCVDTSDPKYFQKTQYTAYGIGVDLAVEPTMVLLDDRNFTTQDMKLNYTVQPAEYGALAVDLDVYKKPPDNQETLATVLYGDKTQGQGSGGFSRGSVFDAGTLYTAEAVLNPGSDIEVRGPEKKVELPVAQINLLTDEDAASTKVDEVRYSDGTKARKRYKIEMVSGAVSSLCNKVGGKLQTVDKNMIVANAPQDDTQAKIYYGKSAYDLMFLNDGNVCRGVLEDPGAGIPSERLVLTNKAMSETEAQAIYGNGVTPVYGGLGNKLQIAYQGATKNVPIEPVGIIVLGIDGLRQDVLYSTDEEQVHDLSANYFVETASLKGMCDVLGGTYDGTTCNPEKWEYRHIKLPNVTAIFPSITLASWASIFSGKMPNETGILGNEFFARDLVNKHVPLKFDNPGGMITFDSGAFKGYDEYKLWNMLWANRGDKNYFFVPYQADWKTSMSIDGTPQNDQDIYKPNTVFEDISSMAGVNSHIKDKGGDPVVVSYSHYARGAYWLTWDIQLAWGESQILDKASWKKFDDYLGGKYLTANERNTVPFSALTVWYLPGLDHQAHLKGMSEYRSYFQNTTDAYVKKVVDRLKSLEEFDNKIFIVVADHGHTDMPTFEEVTLPDQRVITPDTSCKFDPNFFYLSDVQDAEKWNNNLHIWELAEMFKSIGESGGTQYRVLAPSTIAAIYTRRTATNMVVESSSGATSNIDNANVIAALDGPMAHIYFRHNGSAWGDGDNDPTHITQLAKLAQDLQNYLASGGMFIKSNNVKNAFKNLLSSVDRILIRVGGVYKDFTGVEVDVNANVIGLRANVINETNFDPSIYTDALSRITGMNDIKRSGDIVLLMKDDVDIPKGEGIATRRYTTGVACKSWHGSLNKSDSYVPLILSYPAGNTSEIKALIDTSTICPTLQCEGNWKVADMIKAIIKQEYQPK